jgi:N,N'-diacetyllegionaminate synthase
VSVFIIAEAGVNHNGSLEVAHKLIDVAAKAGADAVKFQTFKAENLVTKNTQKAGYQQKVTDPEESQFEMIKKLELNLTMHVNLKNYCEKKNIIFLSSPFDIQDIKLLERLNLSIYKIPSGEITNLPYLRYLGKLNKKIILSTGMSTLSEIKEATKVLTNNGTNQKKISILHASTIYPTPIHNVNLKAMLTIKNHLNFPVGYSDHTIGIEVSNAAVAMGASIIEKHFTLDRSMDGPDHQASLEPKELESMVNSIRNIELALGSDRKFPSEVEVANSLLARKSIHAKKIIKKGDYFSTDNIIAKRPGIGISPMKWDSVMGLVAKKDFEKDELISL